MRTKSFEADDAVVTELQSGQGLTPFRSHMDDVRVCLQKAACPTRLLKKTDKLVTLAGMRIKVMCLYKEERKVTSNLG